MRSTAVMTTAERTQAMWASAVMATAVKVKAMLRLRLRMVTLQSRSWTFAHLLCNLVFWCCKCGLFCPALRVWCLGSLFIYRWCWDFCVVLAGLYGVLVRQFFGWGTNFAVYDLVGCILCNLVFGAFYSCVIWCLVCFISLLYFILRLLCPWCILCCKWCILCCKRVYTHCACIFPFSLPYGFPCIFGSTWAFLQVWGDYFAGKLILLQGFNGMNCWRNFIYCAANGSSVYGYILIFLFCIGFSVLGAMLFFCERFLLKRIAHIQGILGIHFIVGF